MKKTTTLPCYFGLLCLFGVACSDTGQVPFVFGEYEGSEQDSRTTGGSSSKGGSANRGGSTGSGGSSNRGGSTASGGSYSNTGGSYSNTGGSSPATSCEAEAAFEPSSCERCLTDNCCEQLEACQEGSACFDVEDCRRGYCDGYSGEDLTSCMIAKCADRGAGFGLWFEYWTCRSEACDGICSTP